jgi:hypothetical protein
MTINMGRKEQLVLHAHLNQTKSTSNHPSFSTTNCVIFIDLAADFLLLGEAKKADNYFDKIHILSLR